MFATRKSLSIGATSLFALAIVFWQANAQVQVGEDFEADEAVEHLTVILTIGEGEELSEPVALDLGLGFPLWLHPLGRGEGESALFGAVPQRTDATHTARPGSRVSFTFAVAGEPGQDILQRTSQLLAGVRISDIGRIGFISQGHSGWVLGGYEITINDKMFASNDAVNGNAQEAQNAAHTRFSELVEQIAPLETETDDLLALVEAGFPLSEEDQARLNELNDQVEPLRREQNRLQRQIDGSFPWFVETDFNSPWRGEATVGEVRVTVVTAPHSGAATSNFIYYQTGGHKYLLSSPLNPMTPDFGPQEFRLDVLSGPLAAADLRGHAMGMLAHDQPPYSSTPDRWHPERLIVEVDGRLVYDSDDSEMDRLSLEAIRLIPPAHLDQEGNVMTNTPGVREAHVWEAGKGAGLDLVNGGAEELPRVDDPAYPEPEPDVYVDDDFPPPEDEYCPGFEPGYEPFPGEEWFGPEWVPADPWLDPTWDPGFDPWIDPTLDPPWEPPPSWLDILHHLLHDLMGGADEALDDITGDADGEPVQVENVRLVYDAGNWHVRWDVHGDDSEVTGYVVEILLLLPQDASPLTPTGFSHTVGPDQREFALTPAETTNMVTAAEAQAAGAPFPIMAELSAYLLPRVTPEGEEPGMGGAARPLTDLRGDDYVLITPVGRYIVSDGAGTDLEAEPMPHSGAEVEGSAGWILGPCQSHSGFTFDVPRSGFNVALRLNPTDPPGALQVRAGFIPVLPMIIGEYRITAHVGFLGASDEGNTVQARLWHATSGAGHPPHVLNDIVNVDDRLHQLANYRNTHGAVEELDHVMVLIEDDAINDPEQPVVIFGLRVIRTGP